jgi:hypothetical protein
MNEQKEVVPRERLEEALRAGADLVWSSVAHVSHGGPTREEAIAWVRLANDVLSGNNPPKPAASAPTEGAGE